jgi:hypothetical protein
MRLIIAAAICFATLYLVDAFYFDGDYFSGARTMINGMVNAR